MNRIFTILLFILLFTSCDQDLKEDVVTVNFVHENVQKVKEGYFIQTFDASEIELRSSSCSANIGQLARVMIAWDCVGTVEVVSIKPNGNYVSEFTGVNPNWRHIYEVGDTFETPHLFLRT